MTGTALPEDLLRDLAPQVLGVVARRYGDFTAAEDATQEALLAAALQWPRDGVPDSPRAWLLQVAGRRMLDGVRSDSARRRREDLVVLHASVEPLPAVEDDDSLVLLFLCCHPALTPSSSIALTLRAVGGLTTAEIASAFLVPEATMAQRISRAKQRVRAAGSSFRMPGADELPARLAAVLHVLYLVFNEGYATSGGPHLHRTDLSLEAIRLTRMLWAAAPDDPEVAGLLALMLLTDARRQARTGPAGELVPLAEQDRRTWDRAEITEGLVLLTATLARGRPGPFQLQAAIAAVHDQAARAEDTSWTQVLALYDLLARAAPSPVVDLNRAIAVAMVHGPAAGLALLDGLDDVLLGHHRLPAARAHLHEMAGDVDAAVVAYRAAAARTTSRPEQHYLLTRAARLTHPVV